MNQDNLLVIFSLIIIFSISGVFAEEPPPQTGAAQHKKVLKWVSDYHRKNPSLLICEEVSDEKHGAMVCKSPKVEEIAIIPNEVAQGLK